MAQPTILNNPKSSQIFLVCVDQHPTAMEALTVASRLVKGEDTLYILHVVQGNDLCNEQIAIEQSKRVLAFYDEKSRDMFQSNPKIVLLGSRANRIAKTICKAVKALDIDTLIVGHHCASGLESLPYTSVSRQLVGAAECNVLVAKSKKPREDRLEFKQQIELQKFQSLETYDELQGLHKHFTAYRSCHTKREPQYLKREVFSIIN